MNCFKPGDIVRVKNIEDIKRNWPKFANDRKSDHGFELFYFGDHPPIKEWCWNYSHGYFCGHVGVIRESPELSFLPNDELGDNNPMEYTVNFDQGDLPFRMLEMPVFWEGELELEFDVLPKECCIDNATGFNEKLL